MTELSIWNDDQKIQTIKSMYAANLSVNEFQTFLEIGKRTQLNPFLREIWAVKYKGPAQIFIGRDGYRRLIGRNPNYEYHSADAVYENDEFICDLANGTVNHKYSLKNRGKLIGAYCLVKMKSSQIPFYVFAEFEEYNLGQSLWKSKPATMIKKVAESQAIRMAIPAELNGTYTPEEFGNGKASEIIEHEPLGKEIEPTIENLKTLLDQKQVPKEVIQNWLDKAEVDDIVDLPDDTVNKLISYLNKK